MLNVLPSYLVGTIAALLLAMDVAVCMSILFVFTVPKFLLPYPTLNRVLNRILHWIGGNRIACNSAWMRLTQKNQVGRAGNRVDILVMLHLLNRRIPLNSKRL